MTTARFDGRLAAQPRPPTLGHTLDFGAGWSNGATPWAALLLAVAAHGAIAALVSPRERADSELPTITDMEIVPPEPPPLPPPEEAKQPDAPAVAPPVAHVAKTRDTPPPAARAAALVTAKPEAKAAERPVDFVSDPSGTSYGSGVVARGGTADHADRGAVVAAPPPASPARSVGAVVAPADLRRRATLTESNPCRGDYPSDAVDDAGLVVVSVLVRPTGDVTSVTVVSESPARQGFGDAARRCLRTKHFEPALDRAGTPVTTAATIAVRFVR